MLTRDERSAINRFANDCLKSSLAFEQIRDLIVNRAMEQLLQVGRARFDLERVLEDFQCRITVEEEEGKPF